MNTLISRLGSLLRAFVSCQAHVTWCWNTLVVIFCLITVAVPAAEPPPGNSTPPTYVLVPARGLPKEFAQLAYGEAVKFLAQTATEGSRVVAVDAVDQDLLANFIVPTGSVRQRLADSSMRKGLASLRKAFLDAPAAKPWQKGALSLPRTLANLRAQVVKPGHAATVLLYGSPVYVSAEERFDFGYGTIPTGGGWLYSKPGESPFSIAAVGKLQDWRIHIVTAPSWEKDWAADGICRFLAAYCAAARATLVAVGDVSTVMGRLMGSDPGLEFEPIADDGVMMFRHRTVSNGKVSEVLLKTAKEAASFRDQLEAGGPGESKISAAVNQHIKVRRTSEEFSIVIGYDHPNMHPRLVVVPKKGAAPLSVDHPSSSEGYYHEGVSADGVRYAEVVLKKAPQAGLGAWINLYSISGKEPATGEVAIVSDNIRFIRNFSFRPLRGDGGQNWESRDQSIFWIKVALDDLNVPGSDN